MLEERARELGVEIVRGAEVTGIDPGDDGVTVTIREAGGARRLRAAYLAGCDGGRSAVRRAAGFGFPGTAPTYTGRLGDVRVPGLLADPGTGHHRLPGGYVFLTPGRVMTIEFDAPPEDRDAPMTRAELAASAARVVGRPVEIAEEPAWMSRFTDVTRQADTYGAGGCCWPATPRTCTRRPVARG